jgi:hypothetical protein
MTKFKVPGEFRIRIRGQIIAVWGSVVDLRGDLAYFDHDSRRQYLMNEITGYWVEVSEAAGSKE